MVYQNKLWDSYKSMGERKIAEYLKVGGIRFTYEKPVAVLDGGKTKIWHPDFYLDDYHVMVEYLGMTGKPENDRINGHKRTVYRENRYDVIEIYPSDFKADWQKTIDRGIYNTLEGRLKDYISKRKNDAESIGPDRKHYQASFRYRHWNGGVPFRDQLTTPLLPNRLIYYLIRQNGRALDVPSWR